MVSNLLRWTLLFGVITGLISSIFTGTVVAKPVANSIDQKTLTLLLKAQSTYEQSLDEQSGYNDVAGQQAIRYLEEAMDRVRARGEAPPENWLRFQIALYYELHNNNKSDQDAWRKTVSLYHELINRFPKMIYLRQLMGLYHQRGATEEVMALLNLLYELSQQDQAIQTALSAGWQIEGVPYKAATVVENLVDKEPYLERSFSVMQESQLWVQAKELDRAITVLERALEQNKKAGPSSVTNQHGNTSIEHQWLFTISTLLYHQERFEEVLRYASRLTAITNKHSDQYGQLLLLLGASHYFLGNYMDSNIVFDEALQISSVAQSASQWKALLQSFIPSKTLSAPT